MNQNSSLDTFNQVKNLISYHYPKAIIVNEKQVIEDVAKSQFGDLLQRHFNEPVPTKFASVEINLNDKTQTLFVNLEPLSIVGIFNCKI